jgi:hypothetical protein
MKTIRGLASALAKKEGKKSQARIGDIRELLGLLSDVIHEADGSDILILLIDNGAKRAKKIKRTK